ncbi:MAG: 2-C-methyl-D-erythritol 2,4-cyclodiphosphate synthase [Candidatus Omnitrophica bacterium]|nr:2-C-methyl-D-erythritol 2,4-cyclodiphosphate synthase [Candidatus Omnitrophota bacterium]
MFRIGIGYDIHRLVEGRRLILGGIEIPYIKGLIGHSDGDALLHAICDALLGGIGESDIGEQFPDTNPEFHGIDSKELLRKTVSLVVEKEFKINNVDSIIIAQEPKLTPFKKQMRRVIASILGLSEDCVNVKAKTNEGLGEIGAKQAIVCYAVVILIKE